MRTEKINQDTNRLLTESFKRYPVLKDYSDPLKFAYNAFHAQGGMVIFEPNIPFSFIRPERLNGERVLHLHIGVLNRVDALTVVWSVLHEWGHINQPAETPEIHHNKQLKYDREVDAWNSAELELQRYPNLLAHVESFKAYRKECLKSY